MKTIDFTELILTSGSWFIVGVLVYYVLTFMKVHLIWKIQERVWIPEFEKNIFVNYSSNFSKYFFTSKYIHKGTFSYLFKYKAKSFRILNHSFKGALTKKIALLDAFTFFLKPFIICAFAFVFLRLWIASEFMYDELKIVIGEMKKMLDRLNSYWIIKTLKEWKVWIYFIFSIALILVPRYFIIEKAKGKVKKQIFLILNMFLIILNLSFFGVKAGEKTGAKAYELESLKDETLSMNYDVIKNLTCNIVAYVVADELEKEQFIQEDVFKDFEDKSSYGKNYDFDSDIRDELQKVFNSRSKELFEQIFNIENFQFEPENIKKESRRYKKSEPNFFKEFVTNQNSKNGNQKYYEYVTNSDNWNLKTGKKLNEFVNKLTIRKVDNYFFYKLKDIISVVLKYGVSAMLSGGFEHDAIGLESQITLKKVISIWSSKKLQSYCLNKLTRLLGLESDLEMGRAELNKKGYTYEIVNSKQLKKQNIDFVNEKRGEARIKDDQVSMARAKAIKLFENKISGLLNKEVDKINSEVKIENLKRYQNISNEVYRPIKEFSESQKIEFVREFVSNHDLWSKSPNEIYELSNSLDFSKGISSIFTTSSSFHPGPRITCPICNFKAFRNVLNH